MRFQRSNFVLLFWFWYSFNKSLIAQELSKSLPDLPRLCAYHRDPSQYYPCVLNYIGLNSWSLYRCPDPSKFDETSQQCLVKMPVNDAFEQLATSSPIENAQFHRVASFIIGSKSQSNESQDLQEQQQARLVSLPPTIDKLMDSFSMQKFSHHKRAERDTSEQSSGIIWSHGYPLMKIDNRPIVEEDLSINSKSDQPYGRSHHHHHPPPPVNEDELKYKKICYFTNWAQYRPVPGRFEPENIDPFLCTHIIYAFAGINNQTLLITKLEENDEDLYQRVNALKNRNPKLKTLLAVGGWNMKSYAFSYMIHDSQKRQRFVFDTINFLRKHNFDGLEVDWGYPGVRGGQYDDKYYLTLFLEEFQEAAMAQSIIIGQTRLLLGAIVAANEHIVSNGYEIEKITKVLDFINIMTYDFHGSWQNYTGLNAPLYRRYDEYESDPTLNQDFGMSIWLRNGAPAHKLVLGVPLFAQSFLLARSEQNELNSPTVGNGTKGPFTRTAGFLSYFEVCLLQMDPDWQKRTVPDGSESEYMFKDREWISYETLDNIRKRAAYVVANNLGGMFVWSLDMDDFNGAFCNNGTYPYIKNSLALLPTNLPSYI
ncbi:unnamed protein product [Rotaria socialis]|uniref:GH18 domain-containing protein n=2 Tax=Rotaria TaxID=231623 RepID=A0A820W6A8_9BILA|nr:unnamed protein product [Rotaria socialis]CAF3501310.1 unnamed protein product [Rotaria socialis]CAF4246070.1 unnamed protein product [Rotaria socialis]CAF4510913.1 unnamed protein product [Rotaria socialis]